MKNILLIISTLYLFTLIGCSGNTQSNQSNENMSDDSYEAKDKEKYKKTIEFIRGKIIIEHNLKIEDCLLEYTLNHETIKTVKLNKFNPNTIWTDEFGTVVLETKGNIEAVTSQSKAYGKHTQSRIEIYCKTVEDANRTAKAFKYLIEYCGGEDEMY